MQLIFFLVATRMYGYDLLPVEYYDVAWTYSTGDDTILASEDPMMTGQVIAYFIMEVFLVEFTDSTKANEVTAKPITQISYASRRFVRLYGHTNLCAGALTLESISSVLCWSKNNDPVIITEVLKCAMNEIALYGKEDYEKFCGLVLKSGLQINPVPYSEFMAELADQVLTATSKHNIKPQTTTFIIGDSELPRTTARAIDLTRFAIDRVDRVSMTITTERVQVHKLQKLTDQCPPYRQFLTSVDLMAVFEMKPEGNRVWLEGVQVPAQIVSALMWNDIAKAFKGEQVVWITELEFCDLTGGATKKAHHLDQGIRIAKCLGVMMEVEDLRFGDKGLLSHRVWTLKQ